MTEETTSMSQIEVLDATPNDVDQIKVVQSITWLATYPNVEAGITQEDIESQLNSPQRNENYQRWKKTINKDDNSHFFVAKEADKVVGYCSPYIDEKNNANRLGAIYVLPEYQGKGVGGKLMDTAIAWYGLGKDITVHVASYNQNAIDFYKRYGFVETGRKVTDDVAKLPSGAEIPEIEMVRKANG